MSKYKIYKLTDTDKSSLTHPDIIPQNDYFCLYSKEDGPFLTPNNELVLYQTTTKQNLEKPKKKLKIAQTLEAYSYFLTLTEMKQIPFKEQSPLDLANQNYNKDILTQVYHNLDIRNLANIFPNTSFLGAAQNLIQDADFIKSKIESAHNDIENTLVCDQYHNDLDLMAEDFELEYI